MILFELLTGRTPYVGDARSVIAQIVSDPIVPPSRYVPTLPPALVAIVMKALAKDPEQRFQNALELRAALTPFCEGLESISRLLARIPPTSIPRRKPTDASMRSLPPPDSIRESHRTNLSFETSSLNKGWTKNVTVPAVGAIVLLALAIGIRMVKSSERRAANANQPVVTAVDPGPPSTPLPVQVATASPIPIILAPIAPIAPADPNVLASATQTASASRPSPPKPKHIPAATAPAPKPKDAPTSTPATPPTTNPKIL